MGCIIKIDAQSFNYCRKKHKYIKYLNRIRDKLKYIGAHHVTVVPLEYKRGEGVLSHIKSLNLRLGAMLFLISALLSRGLFSTCFHEDCSSGKQSFHFDLIVLSGNCEFIALASNNMDDVLMRPCIETYEVFDVLLSLSNSLVHELQGYLME
ncbi:hypothetical protein ACJX0J_040601 [Zea mays]